MSNQKKGTILITGATGQLGRQCVREFEEAGWDVVGTGFSRVPAGSSNIYKLDLTDSDGVQKLLDDTKPSVVLHCAAERSPDRCAADPAATKALNVAATASLARLCATRGAMLVYISTDYVFSGAQGEAPYAADATTAPPNFYGETKLAGERAVLAEQGKSVVFRVPVLYGEVERNGESAVNTLLDTVWNVDNKEKVEMDAWSIRYPTNTADVARVLKDLIELYGKEGNINELPRILQFSSEDHMTKWEICQTLAEIAGLPSDHMVPNSTNDPNSVVQRPYDCHLSTQALKDIGIDVSTVSFKDWWRRYMRAYRK